MCLGVEGIIRVHRTEECGFCHKSGSQIRGTRLEKRLLGRSGVDGRMLFGADDVGIGCRALFATLTVGVASLIEENPTNDASEL